MSTIKLSLQEHLVFKNISSTWNFCHAHLVKFFYLHIFRKYKMHRYVELIESFHYMYFFAKATTRAQELTHPPDDVLPIIGIYPDDHGHRCIGHNCCGWQVQLNVVLCVYREQICTSWGEETVMCCYIIKDGIDQCHVGFLRHHFAKCDKYNGALIQVVDAIAPDDADAARKVKISLFSWVGQCGHHWSDQTWSLIRRWATFKEKEKKLSIILENKSILIIQLINPF